MDRKAFTHLYFKLLISTLLAIFFGTLTYSLSFYVHEAGHIVVGSIIQILNLKLPIPVISNWIWLWNVLPLPQQTKVLGLGRNLPFALGGSLFVVAISILISLKYFDKHKKHTWLIATLPLVYFFHEFVGNFLFGTDNWVGEPVLSSQYDWLKIFSTAAPWATAIVLFPFIFSSKTLENFCQKLANLKLKKKF